MANQDNGMSDELYEEVLQQWHTVKTRCKNFMGRTDILEVSTMDFCFTHCLNQAGFFDQLLNFQYISICAPHKE